MYSLNKKKTEIAIQIQTILDEVELKTNPSSEDSFVLLAFRTDSRDNYRYLVAHKGLREPETIHGVRYWGSHPIQRMQNRFLDNPRSFRYREGIPIGNLKSANKERFEEYCRVFTFEYNDQEKGSLWINRRKNAKWASLEKVEKILKEKLNKLFLEDNKDQLPLYQGLWYEEKLIRDSYRNSFRELGPMPRLTQTAGVITRVLIQNLSRLLESTSTVRIGTYLFTGEGWELCGTIDEPKFLPKRVSSPLLKESESKGFDWFLKNLDKDLISKENAFEYLHRSNLSLMIIEPNNNKIWEQRLKRCRIEIPSNGGVCIIPLKDPFHQDYAFGHLLISVSNSYKFRYGHCYLLNRVCESIANSLARLLPIPGYPWWPKGHLSRGGATVMPDKTYKETHPPGSFGRNKMNQILRITEDLMPTESTLTVKPLTSGLSGSEVFLLNVSDPSKVVEIPRVLKIGNADSIGDELYRYVKYAHNKVVGGQSRIDIARGYPTIEWKVLGKEDGEMKSTGAIVYTFVGADEKNSIQWSTWANDDKWDTFNLDEEKIPLIQIGIQKVMDQLMVWHNRKRVEKLKMENSVIDQWVMYQQGKRVLWEKSIFSEKLKKEALQKPTIKETNSLIIALNEKEVSIRGNMVTTSISHGDTHCNNIFSIVNEKNELNSVALIDWGKVKSGSHPLTDIAILMADLLFRVKGKDANFEEILKWGENFYVNYCVSKKGYRSQEAYFVIGVHILRMLAWRSMNSGTPWIDSSTRKKAWDWLNKRFKENQLPYYLKGKIHEPIIKADMAKKVVHKVGSRKVKK